MKEVQNMEWIGFGFDLDLIWIEIGVFKKRNVLARPVMGSIFLVRQLFPYSIFRIK